MKIYKWYFILLTLAQMVFTLTWFLLIKKLDRVIILSSTIYAAGIVIGLIAYKAEKYRKRKKELLDNLP